MKLDTTLLTKVREYSDVVVGNIYPAQGWRKSTGTSFWMVVAVSDHGAHLIGFDDDGNPVATASYGKHALRTRPLLARADLRQLNLSFLEALT